VLFRSAAGPDAPGYAAFRATTDQLRSPWPTWSPSQRSGRLTRSAYREADADFYIYCQALANTQMSALAERDGVKPLYLDLPIGVHPDGYDVWRAPHLFLRGVSAGAPPDALYAGGQVWGFPPMHPTAARADGYAYLRSVLRKMFSVAGVLRIDHIMGLLRMYCVPPGFDGTQGAYLHYPAAELFAIVLIEASRAGATVVGEDLGTVPPEIRDRMSLHGLMGMHVQQFALAPQRRAIQLPSTRSTFSLASLNTHDTPTFGGFWAGDDITLRSELGLIDSSAERAERTERTRLRAAVRADLARRRLPMRSQRQVERSLTLLQARSSSAISLINLEDCWGERRPQNVPGTDTEYPNWRRRSRVPLANLINDKSLAGWIRTLARERHRVGR